MKSNEAVAVTLSVAVADKVKILGVESQYKLVAGSLPTPKTICVLQYGTDSSQRVI